MFPVKCGLQARLWDDPRPGYRDGALVLWGGERPNPTLEVLLHDRKPNPRMEGQTDCWVTMDDGHL